MSLIDDLAGAPQIDRAAMVPGMYFAWCANLQLVAAAFEAAHGRELLRLRYRELTPAAFFLKTTGGQLTEDLLSEQGAHFAAHQYAVYRSENRTMLLAAKDDWDTYDAIAPDLTKAYYAFSGGGEKKRGKHWWNAWR
ncbi:MAG TPA: hypothetical protein VIZ30_05735 [Pseudomonadales bacterium]